jgi:hypothetical protein
MSPTKQPAPPPPTGFTGHVPRPGLGQVVSEKWQARRARKAGQPKRPIIQINHHAPARRQQRRGPTPRRYRRRPRRGTLFAVFSVVVATCALTAAIIEFSAWEMAAEVGMGAEFVSFGTAWFFGDPSPRPSRGPKTPRQPRAKGNPPPGSGGHKCGAPTQDPKAPACQNPVTSAGDKCWRHPGGGSGPKTKAAPRGTATGPKKTKKAAPPPAPNP